MRTLAQQAQDEPIVINWAALARYTRNAGGIPISTYDEFMQSIDSDAELKAMFDEDGNEYSQDGIVLNSPKKIVSTGEPKKIGAGLNPAKAAKNVLKR